MLIAMIICAAIGFLIGGPTGAACGALTPLVIFILYLIGREDNPRWR